MKEHNYILGMSNKQFDSGRCGMESEIVDEIADEMRNIAICFVCIFFFVCLFSLRVRYS